MRPTDKNDQISLFATTLISAFPVEYIINEIVIKKTKNDMMKPLHKQIRLIVDVLNRDAKKFIQVNGI